jgi:hypothetical protein
MMNLHNKKIHSMMDHPTLRVRLIAESEIRQIDPNGRSMFNVNTPSDLEDARSMQDAGTGFGL